MSTRDDVIENAQHFRDAAKDCVVQLAEDTFVVTVNADQAETLRAFVAEEALTTVSLGDHLTVDVRAGQEEVVTRVLDSLRSEIRGYVAGELAQHGKHEAVNNTGQDEPVLPVKRGPGRPRKAQG
jgi:hypothetical protein